MDGHGKRLGVIAAGPSSDRQDQIGIASAGDGDSLPELLKRGIRHHPRYLLHALAVVLQDPDDFAIDAVPLDGALAVDQQDRSAEPVQLLSETGQRPFPEVHSDGIAVREYALHAYPSRGGRD